MHEKEPELISTSFRIIQFIKHQKKGTLEFISRGICIELILNLKPNIMKKIIMLLVLLFLSSICYSQDKELIDKVFFVKSLESFAFTGNTPSPRQFSAEIKNDKNSLAFGYTIDNRKDLNKYFKKSVVYLGIKLKGRPTGSFYNIFSSDEFANNFGMEFKYRYVFSKKGKNIEADNDKFKSALYDISVLYVNPANYRGLGLDENKDVNNKKIKNFSINKLWFSLEGYIPISDDEYNVTETSINYDPISIGFSNWDFKTSLNLFSKGKSGTSIISLGYKIYNNNNALSKELNEEEFIMFEQVPTSNNFVKAKSKEAFVGVFDTFTSRQLNAEITYLFNNHFIGLSGAIEQNFGTRYDALNWKLGIPLNIKNISGDDAIGIELQWREFNGNHYLGISVGKLFGKLLN
tara:strand:- start:63735 stop:64949 length:1215 start_codon:yes stop_codon:yes gene_type:complete